MGTPAVAPDGQGGFYVAWSQPGSSMTLVMLQHFDGGCNPMWSGDGRAMQQFALVGTVQLDPQVVPDGAGGAIVAWRQTGADTDIIPQRFDAAGNRLWPGGTIRTTSSEVSQLTMTAGKNPGEACLAWLELDAGNYELQVQKLDSDGSGRFNSTFMYSTSASLGDLQVAPFGGGLFAAWMDFSTGGIKFQAMDYYGALVYGSDPDVVFGVYDQQNDLKLVPGLYGTVFMAYRDYSVTSGGPDRIAANYYTSSRYGVWGKYGATVSSTATNTEILTAALADETGGLFLTVLNTDDHALQAVHVDENGTGDWPEGRGYFSRRTPLGSLTMVPDGDQGFLAAWVGYDYAAEYYKPAAQKIDHNGFMADNGFAVVEVADRPNDQGGELLATWQASPLDNATDRAIANYSVWIQYDGDLPPAKAGTLPSDEDLIADLGLKAIDVAALKTGGWTYVDLVPAMYQTDYSAFCPSFGDSMATGIPQTAVRVVAHHADPGTFWESSVLSGHSVDNLAPGAPLNLLGTANGGQVDLAWTASGQHDEDLATYRIYRDTTPGFVPDETNLVGTSTSTTYQDDTAGGQVYYQVRAVDAHGNESASSGEVGVQLAVSAVGQVPASFRHRGNYPNPFNPMTNIAFDLPTPAHVTVTIFDASGRLVRTLVNEAMTAGAHEVLWNGQDGTGRAVASGVYFSRVQAGEFDATRRMTLVR